MARDDGAKNLEKIKQRQEQHERDEKDEYEQESESTSMYDKQSEFENLKDFQTTENRETKTGSDHVEDKAQSDQDEWLGWKGVPQDLRAGMCE